MKWFNRTAQGFSPGSEVQKQVALKGRPNFKLRKSSHKASVGSLCGSTKRSAALSGRVPWEYFPRAEALGYSVLTLRAKETHF
jgi:hypothetical protein